MPELDIEAIEARLRSGDCDPMDEAADLLDRVRELEAELAAAVRAVECETARCESAVRAERAQANEIMSCGHARSALRWTEWPDEPEPGDLTTVYCGMCHAETMARDAERKRCRNIIERHTVRFSGYTVIDLDTACREIDAA